MTHAHEPQLIRFGRLVTAMFVGSIAFVLLMMLITSGIGPMGVGA